MLIQDVLDDLRYVCWVWAVMSWQGLAAAVPGFPANVRVVSDKKSTSDHKPWHEQS